jgi:hypothetical protein
MEEQYEHSRKVRHMRDRERERERERERAGGIVKRKGVRERG